VVGHLTLEWEAVSGILDHSGMPDRYHLPFSHQSYDLDIWDAFSKVQVIEHQREARNLAVPINSTLLDVLSRFRATYSKSNLTASMKRHPKATWAMRNNTKSCEPYLHCQAKSDFLSHFTHLCF